MKKITLSLILISVLFPNFVFAMLPASETEFDPIIHEFFNIPVPVNRSKPSITPKPLESTNTIPQEQINGGIVDEQAQLKFQLEQLQKQILILMEIIRLMNGNFITQA
jgi:hypothetical protein